MMQQPERKVDVVVVTRKPLSEMWLRNLKMLPAGELIVVGSSPLSVARYEAIQKVRSEWFLFLDDDVYLCSGWWSCASQFLSR